jgi:hypothetical protein
MAAKKVGKSSEPSVKGFMRCDAFLLKYLEGIFEKVFNRLDSFKPIILCLHELEKKIDLILGKEDKIMSDIADADAILVALVPVITKIGGETDGLLAKITALMANVGGNTPETQALLAHAQAIKDALKTVDDKVADAAPQPDPGP